MTPAPSQVITTWEAVVTRADGTVEDLGVISRSVETLTTPPVGPEEAPDGPHVD